MTPHDKFRTLTAFLATYGDQHLDVVARALHENIKASGGFWLLPKNNEEWPSSYHIEISYLDVFATGESELEVARNWLRIAKTSQLGSQAA